MTRLLKPCLVVDVDLRGRRGRPGQQASPTVFINEIHYDNTGTDAGEFIEIAGPAGTNLSDYSLVLYNGATGAAVRHRCRCRGRSPISRTASVRSACVSRQRHPEWLAGRRGARLSGHNGHPVSELRRDVHGHERSGKRADEHRHRRNRERAASRSACRCGSRATGTAYADFTWNAPAGQSPGAVNAGQSFSGTAGATIAIDDVSVTEGNSGTVDATFTVTRVRARIRASRSTSRPQTAPGRHPRRSATATTWPRSEIAQLIPAGSATYTFTVAVNGDPTFEPSEQFSVTLSNVSGATVADGQGAGTITNDDAAPPVVSDVVISQVYGGGGNTGATFTHDFIELFNRGTTSVSLAGWSVQYIGATATGTWSVTPLDGSIAPGGTTSCSRRRARAARRRFQRRTRRAASPWPPVPGKWRCATRSCAIAGACPAPGTSADLVGYGATTCIEGAGPTAATSNTLAALAQARRVLRFRQQQRRLLDRLAQPAQQRHRRRGAATSFRQRFTRSRAAGSRRRFWAWT